MIKFITKSILNKTYFYKKNNNKNFSFFTNIGKNEIALKKLLKQQSLPFFVTQKSIIVKNYTKIKNSLNKNWGGNNQLAYSFKTNYSVIGNSFFKKNFWAEVVSENELLLANQHNYEKIIFNGPAKTINSLKKAAKLRAIVNIDNLTEIEIIKSLTKKEQQQISWGLRLKVDSNSRFGFSIKNNEAKIALTRLKKNKILIKGLHLHLGTNNYKPEKYKEAAILVKKFIKDTKLNNLDFIDFGGGFPSHAPQPNSELKTKIEEIEKYIVAISSELANTFTNKKPMLILEPGRFIVEDAQILITNVLDIKTENKKQKITCSATNNMLPLTHYRPNLVRIYTNKLKLNNQKENLKTQIFGSSCQEDDLIFVGDLPKVNKDDLIVFFAVGAYNSTIGGDFIFKKPKLFFI